MNFDTPVVCPDASAARSLVFASGTFFAVSSPPYVDQLKNVSMMALSAGDGVDVVLIKRSRADLHTRFSFLILNDGVLSSVIVTYGDVIFLYGMTEADVSDFIDQKMASMVPVPVKDAVSALAVARLWETHIHCR